VFKIAIPVLRVSDAAQAEEFYCQRLGFHLDFAHRSDDARPDPCYMGLSRDDARLHVSSFPGDGVYGSAVHLFVSDVDALHAELVAKGVAIDAGHPVEQDWGTREMYLSDPDGNRIRFAQVR
jgi:catechol 2,3-dioxygenase-like lactoylglutathione lyase family enzyme